MRNDLAAREVMTRSATPMHEDCCAMARQNDVGRPGEAPTVQPKAISERMQKAAYHEFGFCVRLADAGHEL